MSVVCILRPRRRRVVFAQPLWLGPIYLYINIYDHRSIIYYGESAVSC